MSTISSIQLEQREPRFTLTLPSILLGVSTFLSALLLFQVQPMAGKVILPTFGGTASVWSMCLVFFQFTLFLGYLYAHLLTSHAPPRRQFAIHTLVVAIAATLALSVPNYPWASSGPDSAAFSILYLLAAGVGVPYFLLASTSPLLQAWYARADPRGVPYRLYAVSNLASLIGLLCYPFLLEPLLTLRSQLTVWRSGFWLLSALLAGSIFALHYRDRINGEPPAPLGGDRAGVIESPSIRRRLAWLALPACSSAMLLAVTAHITENIAPIPLFWIVPLAIFLGSFAICFEREDWYDRDLFRMLLIAALSFISLFAVVPVGISSVVLSLSFVLGGLAVVCMFCHGELYVLRPPSRGLTAFYLYVSLGGALGGLFVGLISPHIFSDYGELPLLVCLCTALAFALTRHEGCKTARLWGLLLAVFAAVAAYSWSGGGQQILISARNFYGVLKISDWKDHPDGSARVLRHGQVIHGLQYLEEGMYDAPTAYYGPTSGIGMILGAERTRPWRVGVLGLGAGTLAIYGRPGDVYRFYEINPIAVDFARDYFTFLDRAQSKIELVTDDARLALEREPPQKFDVLIADAFSGDAVPLHLLTKQAFEEYSRHLNDGGVLAVNVSNLYLDLAPVVQRLAAEIGRTCVIVTDQPLPDRHLTVSVWALLLEDRQTIERLLALPSAEIAKPGDQRLWTDDYANLLSVLR